MSRRVIAWREADRMEQSSSELGSEIEQVRSDWQRKRADGSVPGATPPDNEEDASSAAEDEDENESSDAEVDDENTSA